MNETLAADFTSVRNHNERAVFEAVSRQADRFPGLRTPRWRRLLEAELAALASPDGRIALGFEVAYGHAFKAAPRARSGEPTRVSLDSMRSLVRSGRGRKPGPVLG